MRARHVCGEDSDDNIVVDGGLKCHFTLSHLSTVVI